MREYVTVVSGAPRSGTSLMMRMLEAGGIVALQDGRRPPDRHNPHGYFEYGPVKRLAEESGWLEAARGKAVKIVYPLLRYLAPHLEYRVLFMERDLEEMFESQREMLVAKGDATAVQQAERLIPALAAELRDAKAWMLRQPNIRVLAVAYGEVVREPARWSRAVSEFLGGDLDEPSMATAVDPSQYHHRRPVG